MTAVEAQLIVGALVGGILAIAQQVQDVEGRIAPLMCPMQLLLTCAMLFVMALFLHFLPMPALMTWCASVMLQAGVYYTLLLALHPLLRRTISGKGRAVLWILPNVRYAFINTFMRPRWIVPVKREWLLAVLTVWGCGAAAVLIRKIAGHIRFRREILRDACDAPAETVERLRAEERRFSLGWEYRPVISPAVKTPLSIGLFRRSIRIVLPERDYSGEELALIFRHELVHIQRQDSGTKLFLSICAALSWFNPFVWLALRCSREDFESGCDEIVLADEDEDTRRLYAELLLDTAADERGFTTCLSADAASLRKRLKDVVKPKERFAGSLTTGVLIFLLFVTGGQLAVAYDGQSAGTLLFDDLPAEAFTYSELYYSDESTWEDYPDGEWTELTEYLAGLRVYKLAVNTGAYADPELSALCVEPEGRFYLRLSDRVIEIAPADDTRYYSEMYYCADEVDWACLRAILEQ